MQTEHASPTQLEASRIAQDFQLRRPQVETVMRLLDEGCTVPYIARYAREKTGGLPEDILRRLADRIAELKQHGDRKTTILKNLEAQQKLTPELKEAIEAANTPRRLDDLYTPYRPKKKSTAQEPRDRGLEPLALAIWNRDPAVEKLDEVVNGMVAPEKMLLSADDVMNGVQLILAEMLADMAAVRAPARPILWETGVLTVTKNEAASDEKAREYRDFVKFSESIKTVPPHRILLINRGERENVLKVKVEADGERIKLASLKALNLQDHPHQAFLLRVADDAITRLLMPALEKEVRRELADLAAELATDTACRNLRGILMQPPLIGRKILAIDPGMRNGCKVVALSEHGDFLEETSIFPHSPQHLRRESKHAIEKLVRKHGLSVIALGNGTASRETEILVSELIHALDCQRKGLPIPEDAIALPPRTESAPPPPPAAEVVQAPATAEAAVPETPPSLEEEHPPATGDASVPADALPTAEAPAVEHDVSPPEMKHDAAPSAPDVPAAAIPEVVGETPRPEVVPPSPAPEVVPVPPPASPVVLEDLSALPPAPEDLAYAIVSEVGVNDYAVSPVAREEFPELDATVRAAISIGRRLQDPLKEFVKIDPLQIGVGIYQQDLKLRHLREKMETVIESCVNEVGVDLNRATLWQLRFASGLNPYVARDIVDFRSRNGAFKGREQLLQIPSVTPDKYRTAAGFLFVAGGDEPLDETRLHPEQYPLLKQLIAEYGFATADLADAEKKEKIKARMLTYNLLQLAERWQVSEDTVRDVFDAVFLPTADPRLEGPAPILKRAMLQFEDLKEGMEIQGAVLNVVPFGAFVDIGLRDSGLVHISQMANRFIRSPYDVVSVGDIVNVWILKMDSSGKKVSLTMLDPNPKPVAPRREPQPPRQQERPPQGDRPPRPQQADRPPQGDRAPRPPQHAGAGTGGGRPFQGRPGGGPGGPGGGGRPGGPGGGGGRGGPPPRREPRAPSPPPAPTDVTPPSTRAPRPDKPLPKLSGEALKGKAALNTFGELAAFFKAKDEPEKKSEEKKPEGDAPANG